MMIRFLIPVLFVFITIAACKKKDEDPVAPVIEFKGISVSTVEQFDNNPVITFTYEDYQGDLGETDPDNYSIRVKDSRLNGYDWYHVPPMTPDLKELHIKGSYSLELNSLFLLGSGDEETASFSVQIRDRAGHWSNIITTPNVVVVDSL